jgi:hypothetical protein
MHSKDHEAYRAKKIVLSYHFAHLLFRPFPNPALMRATGDA